MAIHKIDLTFQTPSPVLFDGREVFRLTCIASNGENMPDEIFGFQQTLVDANTGKQQDEFSFICSPYELAIYPANQPDPQQSPQYFRKAEIDILLPSVTLFEQTEAEIIAQVTRLCSLLDTLDNLSEVKIAHVQSSGVTYSTP